MNSVGPVDWLEIVLSMLGYVGELVGGEATVESPDADLDDLIANLVKIRFSSSSLTFDYRTGQLSGYK